MRRRAAPRSIARRVARWLGLACLWFAGVSVALVLVMRWVPPVGSAMMVEDAIGHWVTGDFSFRLHYQWQPWERLSRHIKLAVIASEDQKFAFHPGFDFAAIDKALKANQRGRKVRGASTISQQVAKNLFLWPGRSWVRKGLEVWFTVLIEALWPKQRILEVYLNIAEMGPSTYGAEAAAQRYFHKPAKKLTRPQAALLAATLPNPIRYRADRPSRFVLRRQAWILGQMNHLGGAEYIRHVEEVE